LLTVSVFEVLPACARPGFDPAGVSIAMSAVGAQCVLEDQVNANDLASNVTAARPPDEVHHFGHDRYETLMSFLISATAGFGGPGSRGEREWSSWGWPAPTIVVGCFVVLSRTNG
jgi:hypothetical protein